MGYLDIETKMEELWKDNGRLIEKRIWGEKIDSLHSEESIENNLNNKEKAKQVLKNLLISAVKKRIPAAKFGIFFSGGVDSSLIAALCKSSGVKGSNFICYAVGFQEGTKEPEDLLEAKKVAEKLGFNLVYKKFNLSEAEEVIKKTVSLLKKQNKTDVVNVGVGSVVLAAAELSKYSGLTYFFSGLGSEELFAGYERHSKCENINEECWQGLKQMWERDLVRDFTLAQALGISISTPFLDKELIEYALKLPAEWKISVEEKKIILREVAEEFLGEFAWRKKKAAQYGSCFDKAIDILARKNGFKFKKDYLESL
ncbi:MAG: asparagine synthase-related protein [Nanoarchaeota archaeon]